MVTIKEIDDTPVARKLRVVRWVNGRRVKSRVWFDDTEPTTGPIRKYTHEKGKSVQLRLYGIRDRRLGIFTNFVPSDDVED